MTHSPQAEKCRPNTETILCSILNHMNIVVNIIVNLINELVQYWLDLIHIMYNNTWAYQYHLEQHKRTSALSIWSKCHIFVIWKNLYDTKAPIIATYERIREKTLFKCMVLYVCMRLYFNIIYQCYNLLD
jgi:hypothetical protein